MGGAKLTCHYLEPKGLSRRVLEAHLPLGVAWESFRLMGKVAYRLLGSIANSYEDAWVALCRLATEIDPRTTTELIGEWERAVGLPDACLPSSGTIDERRQWVMWRLSKRRWTTAQDWKDLALLFGVRIAVVPGWIVQKPALYACTYPKRYDHFPKLGRFRVYVDVVNTSFGGYDYGAADRGDGYPVPYGATSDATQRIMCILDRVRPANVVIVWNTFPDVSDCYGHETFEATFGSEFC